MTNRRCGKRCLKIFTGLGWALGPCWWGENWPSYATRWWKDLLMLEEVGGVRWFGRELIRKIGDGRSSLFWKDA